MVDPSQATDKRTEVKGTLVRGIVAQIDAAKLRERVAERLTGSAAALLREPVLATMWIDARPYNEILQAVHDVAGADELRRMNQRAVVDGLSPLVRAVGERVLTMFEASPASFLPRLNRVAETTARGITYSYEPIDDESGYFDMTYATLTDVPTAAFIATAGGLSFLFEMCGVQGTFGEPKWLDSRKRNRMRFLVSWHPRR